MGSWSKPRLRCVESRACLPVHVLSLICLRTWLQVIPPVNCTEAAAPSGLAKHCFFAAKVREVCLLEHSTIWFGQSGHGQSLSFVRSVTFIFARYLFGLYLQSASSGEWSSELEWN